MRQKAVYRPLRWEMMEELMRVLSGVVYRLNRIGPITEPWGTRHVREDEGERCGEMETADLRDDKYEVNHWRERERISQHKKKDRKKEKSLCQHVVCPYVLTGRLCKIDWELLAVTRCAIIGTPVHVHNISQIGNVLDIYFEGKILQI